MNSDMTTFDDPASYWNEEEAGARWVRMRPQIDRLMEPITATLLEAGSASTCARAHERVSGPAQAERRARRP